MRKFFISLIEYATNVINLENKKILPLTKKELNLHPKATACYICGKKFAKDKNYRNVRDHC